MTTPRAQHEEVGSSGVVDVTVAPDLRDWQSALGVGSRTPRQIRARTELGLSTDQPILFSGHQPIVFHNGILAKLIAQHEASLASGAQRVWIVADQDPVNPGLVRVPVGSGASLQARQVHLLASNAIPDSVASCALPAMEPVSGIDDPRLEPLIEYLVGYLHETSLARQFANATIGLACDRLGFEPPILIYASELNRSEALTAIIEQILEDPRACVDAYNTAVARYPRARVRPLLVEGTRVELPLWGVAGPSPRTAIDTTNIDRFTPEQLMPRGLLMSALVRTHLGELFIHGTGGWQYDNITQDWAEQWLGIQPSPMALTTATQRLELGIDATQLISLPDAHWAYHHARHHPGLVGDHDTQTERDALVAEIQAARENGADPGMIYQRLVTLLKAHRARNAVALGALSDQIERARQSARAFELATDRTWPFVLFDDAALQQLDLATRSAMR